MLLCGNSLPYSVSCFFWLRSLSDFLRFVASFFSDSRMFVCLSAACTLSCLFASCCCCSCCCRCSDSYSVSVAAACLYAKSCIENENVRTVFRTVAFSLCSSARLSYLIQFFQFSKAPVAFPLPPLAIHPLCLPLSCFFSSLLGFFRFSCLVLFFFVCHPLQCFSRIDVVVFFAFSVLI